MLKTGAISGLDNSNGIPTNNHLVCKQTLNHLVKLTKSLSCVVSTYLYGVVSLIYIYSCLIVKELQEQPLWNALTVKKIVLQMYKNQ